ncbi:MAG: coniferyl aldehyde dehydrogenase [Gammaproteobacteria bacterium]|nr:coniferyl aldehyde dehydrogenase [Gammaproteobacteria bacterium]MAV27552.1 coniferyl aldehyde dehydrogenase [Gammaproteobacteria bacterium]RPG25886.1 MAG: coniferyl aldehyde dehydrogenase [Gammaproteobacteria bacterium TMED50]
MEQSPVEEILKLQRRSWLEEGVVTAETRKDRLQRLLSILDEYGRSFCEAMAEDFGHRSMQQSRMTDISGAQGPIKHAISNVKRWMRPEKRKASFPMGGLLGGRARLEYQPLGVVGCISPWNFPVQLTFAPLGGVLAAGNRTMIKPSEFTPATSELMAEAFASRFDESEIALVLGGAEKGEAFSRLPFDHLLFTGATSIAKHVMRAAADNLVPVTLELGGKSPVIIGRSADLSLTARNVMFGKTINAGQICLAPDYVMLPTEDRDQFVSELTAAVSDLYPSIKDNEDYTSIVNKRHYDRLNGYIEDAETKGATVVPINPADEDFTQQEHHKIPPTLILDPTDDMAVMQDEIFGPLLPVKTYDHVGETIDYVNDHDRPLGLYYFGADGSEKEQVLSHTTSGGVTVNDVIMHIAHEDLPFGGVGPSGMGAYHGFDGFKTFSHAKAVYEQSSLVSRLAKTMQPPYKSN